MAFGRPQKVGMKRAKKKKVAMAAHVENDGAGATEEPEPAGAHQASTQAALTQAPAAPPASPGKELRLAAAKDVRVAMMALRKVEKCMASHFDTYAVAERIYKSKKSKLLGGRSKKRGGTASDKIQLMHDLHMCEHEWSAAQMAWMERVAILTASEASVATAELALPLATQRGRMGCFGTLAKLPLCYKRYVLSHPRLHLPVCPENRASTSIRFDSAIHLGVTFGSR